MGKIKLSISSESINNPEEIMEILHNLKIVCQIKSTFNIILTHGSCKREKGAIIYFYNLKKIKFKDEIWPILRTKFNLDCGFVETKDYKGCIMDWPGVFRKTKCPGNIIYKK